MQTPLGTRLIGIYRPASSITHCTGRPRQNAILPFSEYIFKIKNGFMVT